MIFTQFSFVAVILLGVTSIYLLVSQNWRTSILALAVQYLGVFWLVGLVWPFGLAAVKLVAGWMAGAVLSASQPSEDLLEEPRGGGSALAFRLVASGLIIALIVSATPALIARFPASREALDGGILLIGIGLLQLGMTTHPMRVILGLLTVLSGFEILYASLEESVLVAGLQAVITLGLALVGAYLLAVSSMEKSS